MRSKNLLILASLLITSVSCVVVPLRRVDNHTNEYSNIPYTVPVRLFEDRVANMVIDLSTPLTFVFCCRSSNVIKGESFCVEQDRCEAFTCVQDECHDRIHSFAQYNPRAKNYNARVFRQKPELDLGLFGFNVPNSPMYNFTANPPKTVYDRQIESTYTDSDFWKYTDGTIGLSYSPFNVSFHRLLATNYAVNKRQFALDIYTQKQREESRHLLQGNSTIFSFGGNLILGTDSIQEYINNSTFSNKPITWSEPLKRYNNRIWRILSMPSDDVRIATDEQLKYIKYEYNYGHRFNMYDLSLSCGFDGNPNLFYNYTGVWQAQIDTTITGLALPTNFYEMVRSWRWNNNNKYDPVLEFNLEQGARTIRVPLKWFEVEVYNQDERIRIAQGMGIISPDPVIRIGTAFLEKYFAVFDMYDFRVGFISKTDVTDVGTCPPRTECIGAQNYYEPTNECLDPECGMYFFQYVDQETKQCTMSIAFYVLFTIALVSCCLSEVIVYEIYRRLSSQLVARAAQANH